MLRSMINAIVGIQMDNIADMVKDPDGDCPKCKPRLGTDVCERCGSKVEDVSGACPAVPKSKRWRFKDPA